MTKFNVLEFIANNAGLSIAEAIEKAYRQGYYDALQRQTETESEIKPHKICYYCYYYGSDIRPECVKCRQKFDVE